MYSKNNNISLNNLKQRNNNRNTKKKSVANLTLRSKIM